MFIRRIVIAASLIAVPIAFAASAQVTPCSYFGDGPNGPDNSICGVPDLAGTFGNVQTNLQKTSARTWWRATCRTTSTPAPRPATSSTTSPTASAPTTPPSNPQ